MAKKIWNISDFTGGISLGSKTGVKGSYQAGTGIDTRLDPDGFSIGRKFTKDSSTTVIEKVNHMTAVEISDADNVFAIDNVGNIYKKIGSGAWAKVRTLSDNLGKGIEYFNDYIYYASDTKLGRYGPLSGSAAFTDAFQTITAVDSQHDSTSRYTQTHAMTVFLNMLCIVNNRYIATYDSAGTFSATALTLPVDVRPLCIRPWGDRLAIGAVDLIGRGFVYLWDGASSTYNAFFEVPSGGVRSMVVNQGVLYMWAGVELTLYAYSGGAPIAIMNFPNMRNGTYCQVGPNNAAIFEGIPLFNIPWQTTSTTITRGTYSFGNLNDSYPEVLGLDFINSNNGASLQLGALLAVGPNLYSGWASGSTYGIDKLEATTVASSATYESHIFDGGEPWAGMNVYEIIINCSPLVSGHTITVKRKADRESSWVTVGTMNTVGQVIGRFPVNNSTGAGYVKCNEFQIQVIISTSGTSSPTVYDISTYYESDEIV